MHENIQHLFRSTFSFFFAVQNKNKDSTTSRCIQIQIITRMNFHAFHMTVSQKKYGKHQSEKIFLLK